MGLPAPNLTALERRLVTTLSRRDRSHLPTTGAPVWIEHRAVGARKVGLEAFVDFADECAEVDVRALQRERARIDAARRRADR